MSLHMQSKVVWTRKTAFTMTALKGFDPCMLPMMSGQLVRPSKSPFATFPGTTVGFFTCKVIKQIRICKKFKYRIFFFKISYRCLEMFLYKISRKENAKKSVNLLIWKLYFAFSSKLISIRNILKHRQLIMK